ncbi:MAG: succinate--CoA ligase subunit alpha, partial [Chloroflexota bacterium]|nr:succinate--CoA ligase subunit alpha [Chloroflexota bacterium]
VIFCEPGGGMEAALARHLKEKGSRLPLVAFIAGHFMEEMPGQRFGHAGSMVEREQDTAREKARLLREAGVLVAEDLSEVPALVRKGMKR